MICIIFILVVFEKKSLSKALFENKTNRLLSKKTRIPHILARHMLLARITNTLTVCHIFLTDKLSPK